MGETGSETRRKRKVDKRSTTKTPLKPQNATARGPRARHDRNEGRWKETETQHQCLKSFLLFFFRLGLLLVGGGKQSTRRLCAPANASLVSLSLLLPRRCSSVLAHSQIRSDQIRSIHQFIFFHGRREAVFKTRCHTQRDSALSRPSRVSSSYINYTDSNTHHATKEAPACLVAHGFPHPQNWTQEEETRCTQNKHK